MPRRKVIENAAMLPTLRVAPDIDAWLRVVAEMDETTVSAVRRRILRKAYREAEENRS